MEKDQTHETTIRRGTSREIQEEIGVSAEPKVSDYELRTHVHGKIK